MTGAETSRAVTTLEQIQALEAEFAKAIEAARADGGGRPALSGQSHLDDCCRRGSQRCAQTSRE